MDWRKTERPTEEYIGGETEENTKEIPNKDEWKRKLKESDFGTNFQTLLILHLTRSSPGQLRDNENYLSRTGLCEAKGKEYL